MTKRRNTRKQRKNKNNSSMQDPLSRSVKVLATIPKGISVTHKFRRSWTQATSYYGNTGWFNAAPDMEMSFALSQSEIRIGGTLVYGPSLPNSSEFINLFDDFRINRVTVRVDWSQDSNPATSLTLQCPLIYFVQDFNDLAAVSVADIMQYPEVKTHSFYTNGYKPLIMELTPRPLMNVAGTGVLNSYGPTIQSPWIRTTEATTPHYGLKLVASTFGVSTNALLGYVQITCAIDIECRGVK